MRIKYIFPFCIIYQNHLHKIPKFPILRSSLSLSLSLTLSQSIPIHHLQLQKNTNLIPPGNFHLHFLPFLSLSKDKQLRKPCLNSRRKLKLKILRRHSTTPFSVAIRRLFLTYLPCIFYFQCCRCFVTLRNFLSPILLFILLLFCFFSLFSF